NRRRLPPDRNPSGMEKRKAPVGGAAGISSGLQRGRTLNLPKLLTKKSPSGELPQTDSHGLSFQLLDSHFLLYFAEALNGEIQILLRMACGNLGSYPVASLGNYRIAEAYHVNALIQHSCRELIGNLGIIEHNRNDGMLSGKQVKAQLLHSGAEVVGVLMNLISQRG